MVSSGLLRRVAQLAVETRCVLHLPGTVNVVPPSPILVILMIEVMCSSKSSLLSRATRLHVTKTAFFINLAQNRLRCLWEVSHLTLGPPP
jgi:hypothetical protein